MSAATKTLQPVGRVINRALRPFGVRLTQEHVTESPDSLVPALKRLRTLIGAPGTIIDIGASDGKWSEMARTVFPNPFVLAFEPLQERWQALDEWCRRDGRAHVSRCVAGAAPGQVTFDVSNDLDGSSVADRPENARTIPLVTVDQEVARFALPGPYLLKLDTHGYELPILDGARQTLAEASAVIVEVYNFRLTNSSLMFGEMCQHLLEAGFRCSDVFDILRRPDDELFWQADFVFLRNDHPAFQRTTYRETRVIE